MSVMDRLGRKRRVVPANATFRLTEEGREKLRDFGSDSKSHILAALETRGSCNADEISRQSHLHRGKVERLLPDLIHSGYVTMISRNQDMEDV